MTTPIVIGIDLGTQGVRTLAVDNGGVIIASASERLSERTVQDPLPPGWAEQDPHAWWGAAATALRRMMAQIRLEITVAGLAVDSTSGTVLPLTADLEPAGNALMYNDARSVAYVPEVRQYAAGLENRLGYAFNASFALPKIVWMLREQAELARRTAVFVHAADYIVGKLTGNYRVTDYSNALKTGYDLVDNRWPSFIADRLGLRPDCLPDVVAPGQVIGHLSTLAAAETSLPANVPVMAGATDGTAAQIASGAVEPGAWNSSLGTTLVIKGITKELLRDPLHRIYSHRHPDGWWMPGGASNTGCEWIVKDHPDEDPAELDASAAKLLPTKLLRYPLARTGERFPFLNQQATGFIDSIVYASDIPPRLKYAAGLEGSAYIERLAYDVLISIGASVGNRIYATGGGSKSALWLQLRASIMNRQIVRPRSSETAMGAALLAATGCWYGTLAEAARNMVKPDVCIDPLPEWVDIYTQRYPLFCERLRARGYLG